MPRRRSANIAQRMSNKQMRGALTTNRDRI
jgi:hypothetical protein